MSADDVAHDWRAEACGLAAMIIEIAEQYRYAKDHWGGDSEFLANRILNAESWCNGPLLAIYERSLGGDGPFDDPHIIPPETGSDAQQYDGGENA